MGSNLLEQWYFRNKESQNCGIGLGKALEDKLHPALGHTAFDLSFSTGINFNRVESESRTLSPGDWTLILAMETGESPGSVDQKIRARISRFNGSCEEKQVLVDQVVNLVPETLQLYSVGPVSLDCVSFDANDVLLIQLQHAGGDTVQAVHFDLDPGPQPLLSYLLHPSTA